VVDAGTLQENYLRLAAAAHPDATGGDVEKFRALQEARAVLLDPARRLRHLLELEGADPAGPGGGPPPADLFLEVAGALEAAKNFLKRPASQSAIARAAQAAERAAVVNRLELATAAVETRWNLREERLRELDGRWPDADRAELARLAGELVFLARWKRELRERNFQIRAQSGA